MNLNDGQKYSLAILDKLLEREAKNIRINDNEIEFLTSSIKKPDCSHLPKKWATDWCKGWYFQPDYAFAQSFGIDIVKRTKTIGHCVDPQTFKPVFEKNKTPKPLIKRWSIWSQNTNFDLKQGYTFHTFPLEHAHRNWEFQKGHNPVIAQITDALPASAGTARMAREPGFVEFVILERDGNYEKKREKHRVTQDNFIRFLITGVMPEQCEYALH